MTTDNNFSENIYYPVSLNIRSRKCVVVGGGQVALRKVLTLLEHGGIVKVISPKLCSELISLSKKEKITVVGRDYQEGDLKGSFVAIIATDDRKINRQIATEVRGDPVLVNVVDDADYSDFISPAHLRRGRISIAISTSGESPALARKIRTRLEEEFGAEYARLSSLVGEVRSELQIQNTRISGDRWQEALDIDLLLELLKQGKEKEAKAILIDKLRVKQS